MTTEHNKNRRNLTAEPRDTAQPSDFTPSGFFVFRTPLLPFAEFLAWGDDLLAASALNDAESLSSSLAQDRATLRARLRAIVTQPEIREALFVASPDLDEFFEHWLREPESKRGERVEGALVRYFARMTSRATPFGLFAGTSLGQVGDETRLVIGERSRGQRHTRLDMDYLFALVEALGRDIELWRALSYRPNSSLYHTAGRVRYVEARLNGKTRTYHLVAVEASDYLADTLRRAANGATLAELAAALIDDETSLVEAEAYIEQLIENQILVPDLGLPVTGPEPIHPLIDRLRELSVTEGMAAVLEQVRGELAALDAAGLGAPAETYRAIARRLESLPTKVELPRLFQLDLMKPAPEATLGATVIEEIKRGVKLLHRISGGRRDDSLARFREAFSARYEEREVRLVEALDEESGIGFPTVDGGSAKNSPPLNGLLFAGDGEPQGVWRPRDAYLLGKLSEALARGATEITLMEHDLAALETKEPLPLPTAFAAMGTIAAASTDAVARGEFQLLLTGANGAGGASLLGRFCHADESLAQAVTGQLRAEEAAHPDAIFAEVAHLPEGRIGNILARPVLRAYEIPYLGHSGAPLERQIPVTDLLLSVQDGRLVLRSERLGREVIPRLTSAHNWARESLGVYKFLCALQHQGVANGVGWSWGALESAPFLPRVTAGRLVIERARWRVSKEELQQLSAAQGAERFRAVQAWRAERKLPRLVVLADYDNTLVVDLENVLSIESFIHITKSRAEATLQELWPAPEQLCAQGPEGSFVHELIVPFVNQKNEARLMEQRTQGEAHRFATPVICKPQPTIRNFPPGSEWSYAKLYCGMATADQVVREVIGPVAQKAVTSGAADQWFFIRYTDPDWHLRVRFHGQPEQLRDEVMPALTAAWKPLLDDERLRRIQFDTYEREVERYGGGVGVELAERLFYADSCAVVESLELLEPGDAGLDERWRLTLRGMDQLLSDLGFDLAEKARVVKRARASFCKEFRANEDFIGQLGDRFRQERKSLEQLLDPAYDETGALALGLEILQQRSVEIAPVAAELNVAAHAGRLSRPLEEIAWSYLHMHANRLLRSAHRAQELVLYDFLTRLYESRIARASAPRQRELAVA